VTEIETAVRDALAQVKDPEIPVCTITDLGLVERIEVGDDSIDVTLLPTFVGCPALDEIRIDAERAVTEAAGGRRVSVRFSLEVPWTTDRITAEGREALRTFGIAPPLLQISIPCPHCGSRDTTLEAPFGPTPCRTIRYCNACRNPFEGFKPKKEH
jgi:ring-1,2-phenylacetyl-CoA epoxidase subunit PaaD